MQGNIVVMAFPLINGPDSWEGGNSSQEWTGNFIEPFLQIVRDDPYGGEE
jgi:hypothetical protein